MKKVCARCGSQLNIAERQCASCSAFNPFYIASFKSQSGNAEIDALEEQLLATEAVAQSESMAKEMHERAIRETAETGLKEEILRVKGETEQYKRQTIAMVNEVRQELHHLDKENKRLKQEVETLHKNKTQAPFNPATERAAFQQKNSRRPLMAIAVFAIGICLGFGYFFMAGKSAAPAGVAANTPANNVQQKLSSNIIAESKIPAVKPIAHKDSVPAKKIIAMAAPPVATKITTATPAVKKEEAPELPPAPAITEAKIKKDMLGSKLSGCGITVNTTSEIVSLSNLVLVDKQASGDMKYKFATRIIKGNETYNATPYAYYNAQGVFVRIDGTNCE